MGRILSKLMYAPYTVINFVAKTIISQSGNEYLVGMVVWGGIGHVAEYIKEWLEYLRAYIVSKLFTSIRLGEQETKELMEYLRNHPDIPNSSMLALSTYSDLESDVSGSRVYAYEPELNTSIRFYHKSKKAGFYGSWVWVANYTYSESSTQDEPMVSTTVTIFGRNKLVVEEMIDMGREMLAQKRKKFLQVITTYNYKKDNYGLGWNHGYETDKKQPGRSIKSVILPLISSGNNNSSSTETDIATVETAVAAATNVTISNSNNNNPNSSNSDDNNINKNGSKIIDQAEHLLEDAREFLESERWYTERGIPYRRGYLLHGIPGGGKSSLVAAVASELKLPIYMLQLSNEFLSDDALQRLFQTMTLNPSIVLLEDIDAASDLVRSRQTDNINGNESIELSESNLLNSKVQSESNKTAEGKQNHNKYGEVNNNTKDNGNKDNKPTNTINTAQSDNKSDDSNHNKRTNMMMLQIMKQQQENTKKNREEEKKRNRKLTLSGLLNALDGPTATTGRLLFMTTNYINKLDPALIRSGRIDYEIEFKPVLSSQIKRLFQRFYLSYRDGETETRQNNVNSEIKSLAEKFADKVNDSGLSDLSAADIQGHLMKYKSNPVKALENLDSQLLQPRLLKKKENQNLSPHRYK
jgi:SpoVK/Ycf46/Vps4 family AAA+-type ATPase